MPLSLLPQDLNDLTQLQHRKNKILHLVHPQATQKNMVNLLHYSLVERTPTHQRNTLLLELIQNGFLTLSSLPSEKCHPRGNLCSTNSSLLRAIRTWTTPPPQNLLKEPLNCKMATFCTLPTCCVWVPLHLNTIPDFIFNGLMKGLTRQFVCSFLVLGHILKEYENLGSLAIFPEF